MTNVVKYFNNKSKLITFQNFHIYLNVTEFLLNSLLSRNSQKDLNEVKKVRLGFLEEKARSLINYCVKFNYDTLNDSDPFSMLKKNCSTFNAKTFSRFNYTLDSLIKKESISSSLFSEVEADFKNLNLKYAETVEEIRYLEETSKKSS